MTSICMNFRLNVVMAHDNFISYIGIKLFVCLIPHNLRKTSASTEKRRASWYGGVTKTKVHTRLQNRNPLIVRRKKYSLFPLNRNSIQRGGVVGVSYITNYLHPNSPSTNNRVASANTIFSLFLRYQFFVSLNPCALPAPFQSHNISLTY